MGPAMQSTVYVQLSLHRLLAPTSSLQSTEVSPSHNSVKLQEGDDKKETWQSIMQVTYMPCLLVSNLHEDIHIHAHTRAHTRTHTELVVLCAECALHTHQ